MGRNKKKKEQRVSTAVAIAATAEDAQRSRHFGPCIVAALLWLTVALYALLVVRWMFNADLYRNMPGPLRSKMTLAERTFGEFQSLHGIFWLSLLGLLCCGFAYARRSVRSAHVAIIIGVIAMVVLIVGTLTQAP